MHYAPESLSEVLQSGEGTARPDADERPSFHYRSAPLYALTALVGALLAADLLLGVIGGPEWASWRTVGGFRLALLAAVLGGARILYETLDGLFSGRIGADVALTIACLAAIILGEHETAALVVFIALCGESLEGYTVDRAQQAIRRVFDVRPPMAHRLQDGEEHDCPAGELSVGDMLVVRPGERLPADGRILEGASSIDQSALTGESLPVDVHPGDRVYAGTLNQFGSIVFQATSVGEQTRVAEIARSVRAAARQKAPLERTADRLAGYFLPAIRLAAFVTLVGWRVTTGQWQDGFLPALGVLVVACPCPLILATPSAVMATLAWLAREGVVIKGSVSLEQFAHIDTIAFDKTGTLTEGRLQLGDIHTRDGLAESDLLKLAAAAERRSEHPLGRFLVEAANERNLVLPAAVEFSASPGAGVTAILDRSAVRHLPQDLTSDSQDDCRVLVGSSRWMAGSDVEIDEEFEAAADALAQSGQTAVWVAVDNRVIGVLGVRDIVRAEAAEVLNQLRSEGVTSFSMLTGDRQAVASNVGQALLIDDVQADLLPEDKARWITERIASGGRMAFVGDGMNDGPALASASVGVALGTAGSDLAAEAGDIVLMGDPLRPLPSLLRLSRELVKTIRQSIYLFAFGFNGLGIVLCGLGWLSPAGGAVFHEIAALAVMLNSMRLLWFERWETSGLGRGVHSVLDWADRWAERFAPSRIIFLVMDRWRLLLRLTCAVVLAGWFCSGIVILPTSDAAVVTRFGRYHETLLPGWYWRWPQPFEQVYRESVDRLRTLEIGFRSQPTANEPATGGNTPEVIEWTSEHDGDGDVPAGESLVLTGDEVPVELTAEVHYQIADLQVFVFASFDEAVFRAMAESVVRDLVARLSLEGILTSGRDSAQQHCRHRMQQLADRYRLGIAVTDFNLLDVHPPRAVVPAYRQVADAIEKREQSINEGEAYAERRLLEVAGQIAVERLLATQPPVGPTLFMDPSTAAAADARRQETDLASDDDWGLSDSTWQDLVARNDGHQRLLAGEAASQILQAERLAVERVQQATGQAERFGQIQMAYESARKISSVHMYWEAVKQALAGRPITIVDPAATSRQHVLFDQRNQTKSFAADPRDVLPFAAEVDTNSGREGMAPRSPLEFDLDGLPAPSSDVSPPPTGQRTTPDNHP